MNDREFRRRHWDETLGLFNEAARLAELASHDPREIQREKALFRAGVERKWLPRWKDFYVR